MALPAEARPIRHRFGLVRDNRMLWTYREDGFLPHGLAGKADPETNPVLIGSAAGGSEEHQVLINLAREV
ncbi:MAG: DNA polymerase III subunit chi, partial [Candidatus Sedimenticola endophacoides]